MRCPLSEMRKALDICMLLDSWKTSSIITYFDEMLCSLLVGYLGIFIKVHQVKSIF